MNRFYKAVICIICCINSHQLFAEDSGFYVGGAIGYASVPHTNPNLNVGGLTSVKIRNDTEGLGWKLFTGYHFNEYFGAEFSFLRAEDNDFDLTFTGTVNGTITSEITTDAYKLAVTARYPLTEKVEIFANLGALIANEDEETVTVPGTGLRRERDNFTTVGYGAGFRYKLADKLSIRVELEGGGSHPASLYTGGLEYRF